MSYEDILKRLDDERVRRNEFEEDICNKFNGFISLSDRRIHLSTDGFFNIAKEINANVTVILNRYGPDYPGDTTMFPVECFFAYGKATVFSLSNALPVELAGVNYITQEHKD